MTRRTRLFEAAFAIVGAVPQQESPHDEDDGCCCCCCCGEDEIGEDEDGDDEEEQQDVVDECGGDGDGDDDEEEEEQQEEEVVVIATGGVLIGECEMVLLLLDALVFWDEQHDGLATLLSIVPSSSLKVIRMGLGAIARKLEWMAFSFVGFLMDRGRITVEGKTEGVNAPNLYGTPTHTHNIPGVSLQSHFTWSCRTSRNSRQREHCVAGRPFFLISISGRSL